MINKTFINSLFPAGAILVFVASILAYYKIEYVEFLFALGAITLIAYHAILAYNQQDKDRNVQRLYRMGFISSLFLGIATYFMFTESNSWIVMVLIYTVTTLYISFRIK
jgi:hypothetical protein